jgi:DNA-binding NarL/FixJ family response regulator
MVDRMRRDIRVAIVEDQKQTREGLAALIGGTAGYRIVGMFASMEETQRKLPADPPDVVLLDIGLPGMSGVEGVAHLKARWPFVRILMLTVYGDNRHVLEAICAGAVGYLLKDTPPAKLLEALGELADGGAPMSPDIAHKVVTMFQQTASSKPVEHDLTARELEILKLLADGHTYKTAAATFVLSEDTIRYHIRHIYEKLHVHSKSEAVLRAVRAGLIR